MKIDHKPIEVLEEGFSGIVRPGPVGRLRLPDLIAHRPEKWRFERMTAVLTSAVIAVEQRLGPDAAARMLDGIGSFSDLKGDFLVEWRPGAHDPKFEPFLATALAEEGEDEICHEISA
ncbi:hypothetical protein [Porphyrobacter sp. LM 6]|uniref:hypothetical protein n=1 Tax=Porphyrobacter sp. LM 6 TaxID=1896196 RepID=UPI000846BD1C|nr:hypothetical protein [Porphyrobacter sp. LM 6]